MRTKRNNPFEMIAEKPITLNNVRPFIHPNGSSTERNCADAVMELLGLDAKNHELMLKLVFTVSPWIQFERENS